MQLSKLFVCTVLLIVFVNTNLAHSETYRACGFLLNDLIAVICDGNYNGKRNLDDFLEINFNKEEDTPYALTENNEKFFMRRGKLITTTRGLHDDCCRRSCSRSEVEMYCAAR